jgi:phosphocarrier protein HPr
MLTQIVKIENRRGLHARASAKFVELAERFNAQVTVSKDDDIAAATSIMGLMMLGASCGSEISISAKGDAAQAALAALVALVERRFDEE